MATTTINPNSSASVTYDAWSNVGGADKVTSVSDASDATSIASTGTSEVRQGFFWEDVLGAEAITEFTYTLRGQNNTANHPWRMYIRVSGADDDSDTGNNFNIGSVSEQTMSNIAGLAIPSVTNFNAAEVGVIHLATADPNALSIMKISCLVTYTPTSGGFAFLVASWLPPLLAAASHGLIPREVATILHGLKTRPSSDEEFQKLLEAFRRRPVFA